MLALAMADSTCSWLGLRPRATEQQGGTRSLTARLTRCCSYFQNLYSSPCLGELPYLSGGLVPVGRGSARRPEHR
jgi:hypothetical protein